MGILGKGISAAFAVALMTSTGFWGCGSDGDGNGGAEPGVGTHPWSSASDACWECLEAHCEDSVNACSAGCWDLIDCALEQECVSRDLAWEATCIGERCDVSDDAAVAQVTSFDICLLFQGNFSAGVRACEDICNIEAFPPPEDWAPEEE